MPISESRRILRSSRVGPGLRGPGFVLLALLLVGNGPSRAESPAPEVGRLRKHVETLASEEFGGRRGRGAARAAAYIEAEFRDLGLEPLFSGEFAQKVEGDLPGRNVGALIRGSDPMLRDEFIIVSAHFDHLGVRGGVLYPGADDNASGVSMMLEVARVLAASPASTRRSVAFIGFDLEEYGLLGSKYFVEHPPMPLDRIKLFITADMIARSLGGVVDPYVFVMGAEHAPGLRPWVEEGALGLPLKVGQVGSDLLVVDRSDYGPFRLREIPYLFFSTGENPAYHTPDDSPGTLDYPKFEAIARLVHNVVVRAAGAEVLPAWSNPQDNPLSEAKVLLDVLRCLLDHEKELEINALERTWITTQIGMLEGILERGEMTPPERARMLRGAQFILYSVL
jgi:hypothetical protein